MGVLVVLSPTPRQLFLNPSTGAPASGFKLYTYAGGTTTKLATYTDETGNTPNTNPIILDSLGECDIWLPPSISYKFVFSPPTDTDPPTNAIWTVDGVTAPPTGILPTRTPPLTSGTNATYNTPAGVRQLRIRMVGGSAGGSGSGLTGVFVNGAAGGNSMFNNIVATGGVPGNGIQSGGNTAAGVGVASLRIQGAGGNAGIAGGGPSATGGMGGVSPFGGAGAGQSILSGIAAGVDAAANSGSGGGGGYNNSNAQSAPGGGAGEYVEIIIDNPAPTYLYSVGPGGAGGVSAGNGGAGAAGVIIVDEIY